ncbi:hypothetical protein AAKU55_005258 [Oxalobacteraceae bacterium GrIS 1.11]
MALSLSFVHPALEVSVQVPVATTTTVAMVASAVTDSRGMNRMLSDRINAIDLAAIALVKGLADAAMAGNPQPVLGIAKPLQELMMAGDMMATVCQFFRDFTEVASSSEAAQFMTGKTLADAAAASDGTEIVTGKVCSDAASSSDVMQLTGTKALADTVAAAELAQMNVNKAASDSAIAADTGRLLMSDYGDFSYFADDFVGISTIF